MTSADHLRLLYLAARMYYLEDKTQNQVAEELGVSRPKVSRLLSQAREEGIVQITVVDPFTDMSLLAEALKRELGLECAIVAPGVGQGVQQSRRRVGAAAARYLVESLSVGAKIGIGWGRTLYEMASALEVHRELGPTVVPLLGGLGQIDPSFQVHSLADLICTKLGGVTKTLYVPAIVESDSTWQALLASRDMVRIAEAWEELSVALVGIGLFDYGPDFQMLFADYLDATILAQLERSGAVGDVCMRPFDIHGNHITDILPHVISIDVERFKKIPRRVGIAGGARKAEALLGAARGGFINILITDEPAAQRILDILDEENASEETALSGDDSYAEVAYVPPVV